MSISKQQKVELVAQYVEQLKQSQGIIMADYQGMTVEDMSRVRHDMRPIGGKFQVVKNRLMMLALKEAEMSLPEEWLVGPTVVGFCYDDVPPVARVLRDVAKELGALRIKGGLVGPEVISAMQVRAIADLPTREVLLARVLGTINAPASQLTGVIAGGIRQVLNVLQAHVDKLQESGSAPLVG
ncbi:MAG: 50S ribosomal protein L10 [Chloroflexota bacterium]|nr:50S ribosomal protein L10 [Chloroflexota bacterium]